MFAAYGCYFPSAETADYNELMQACLSKLEPYSQEQYVLVFFAQPMEHEPSLRWMYDAYKSLARRYRKNIQTLYVVHPSPWFRLLLWLMRNILSSKFARKVKPVDSLDQLAEYVPMEHIFVPPAVTAFEGGHYQPMQQEEPTAVQSTVPTVRIFGAEVERSQPGGGVPKQILRVVAALEASGLRDEGIFRLSPEPVQIEQIRLSMDRGYDVDLSIFPIYTVAAAFKAYYRQLPTPVIPPSTYESLPHLLELDESSRVEYIRSHVLDKMSHQRLTLLALAMRMLRLTAAQAEVNRMPPRNLAAVWAPNLIRCDSLQEEMQMLAVSQRTIEIMIQNASELFDDYDPISGTSIDIKVPDEKARDGPRKNF
jgi:hypothetical protein